MLITITAFLLFQCLYHIFVVIGGYGLQLLSPEKISILRDGLWIGICFFFFLFNRKYWKDYLNYWGKKWSILTILLLFCGFVSYVYFKKTPTEILIGIKYGLRYFIIFFSAGGLGYFIKHNHNKERFSINSRNNIIKYGLLLIIILGRIRQILKIIFPTQFQNIGYGQLDDFHFGVKPPIYYLTGFEGTLRRQGLFSGPNNYAYFLVLFLPIIYTLRPIKKLSDRKNRKKTDRLHRGILILRLITLGATLSRAGIIGGVIALLLMNISWIKQHKKLFYGGMLTLIIGIIGLSIIKRESTQIHIEKKLGGITEVIKHPLGQGLGSSGPAIHHTGKYLPENFYLQLMIDMGSIGFIFWILIFYIRIQEEKELHQILKIQDKNNLLNTILLALEKGLLSLLVMGLFLHVFEDSMVNYLFFIIYGVYLGYAQAFIHNKNSCQNS